MTINVRDIRTGATLRTFDTNVEVTYGLMVRSTLFWTGYAIPYDPFEPTDGGVWAIDVTDPASTPEVVIEESDLTVVYGPHSERGRLRLTDGGLAITTIVGGDTGKATQIIDVGSLTVRETVGGESILQVDGRQALVLRPDRLVLLDLDTGSAMNGPDREGLVESTMLGDGEVFVAFGRSRQFVIVAVDLLSGDARDVLVQPVRLNLSSQLSTSNLLVLLSDEDPVFDEQGRVQLSVSLLDPATGNLQTDAFTIGDP